MKMFFASLALPAAMIPHSALAVTCEARVLKAVLAVESVNEQELPLKVQVVSYSSVRDTWGVFLQHQKEQAVWTVVTDDQGICKVKALKKERR